MARQTYISWIHLVVLLALGCALVACKSDGAKLIEHYEAIAEIVDENDDDCESMGKALEAYDDAHGEEMRAIWDKGKDMRGTTEEGEKLSQLVIEVQVGVSACGLNVPGFE